MMTEEQKTGKNTEQRIVQVYLDNGVVFKYWVGSPASAREHIAAIVTGGYRHSDGHVFEHYPPHRIIKVKAYDIPTKYIDTSTGT